MTRIILGLFRFLLELEHKSSSVQNIVRVIHDFASQTHLLGLNAAIEAAREMKLNVG
ncbi:methyl-accepting chemotaxis protein [Paenibacillus hamazuiensis]|uniref:methyl-accepting chemotaxis protein n=1 Tax=Paenibacillus hamazuiensis TaxID=2936508 RepID=UPI00200D01B1|nr:methyl-accepting chemotaxis protein [Paenibacillus hamazuiensis]